MNNDNTAVDNIAIAIMGAFYAALELPTISAQYKKLSKESKKLIGNITKVGRVMYYSMNVPNVSDIEEAEFIQELCMGAIKASANQAPAPKYPTWEGIVEDIIERPDVMKTLTHKEWMEVIHAAKNLYPQREQLDATVNALFETLHDNGVDKGRHYMLTSLVWSAAWHMFNSCFMVIPYPESAKDVHAAMALYAVYADFYSAEHGAAVEESDAAQFMDGYDKEAGKRAATTVTFTGDTKGLKDNQRSPFPQDLTKLFAEQLTKFIKERNEKARKAGEFVAAAKAKTEAIMTGRKVKVTPEAKKSAAERYAAAWAKNGQRNI